MVLRSFLWMVALFIADQIAVKCRGSRDGSFTAFLFGGITVFTSIGYVACALWFVVALLAWAWENM